MVMSILILSGVIDTPLIDSIGQLHRAPYSSGLFTWLMILRINEAMHAHTHGVITAASLLLKFNGFIDAKQLACLGLFIQVIIAELVLKEA